MENHLIIKENWLTHAPKNNGFKMTAIFTLLLFGASYFYWTNLFDTNSWMTATGQSVFTNHNYWRAWSTLFAHYDLEHLLSNSALFIPLTFLLSGYFGNILFPLVGIFMGGIINLIVLKTMPETTTLLGISGVVNLMGATWLTLYLLIDRRKKLRYRLAIVLFLTLLLFIPEKYQPQVSYLSHIIGYAFGILSGLIFYGLNKKIFLADEVTETTSDDYTD
ncbi:MAG: rhomboid family intramembrane serine protease [Pseudobdellovibrio sp.]